VDGLLLPSVDTKFLARCSDSTATREEWVRVTGTLTAGERGALAEATNELIGDVSADNWERFLAAREKALHEDVAGEGHA
jgi:hypothetical protein